MHGIDDAIGVPRSILGYIVFGGGYSDCVNAIFMVWYTNGYDYPLVIGGKPLFAWEFSIPPMFELTVLFSAFAAVFGMFALNGLPQFYHPSLRSQDSERATDDRFLLVVEAADPKFDIDETPRLLNELGRDADGGGGEMKRSPLDGRDCWLLAGCAGSVVEDHAGRDHSPTWITRVDMSRRAIERSMARKPIFSTMHRASRRPVGGHGRARIAGRR